MDIFAKVEEFLDFYLIFVATIALFISLYMVVWVIDKISIAVKKIRNKSVWKSIIKEYGDCTVYCLGQVVDLDKVRVDALDRRDWIFRYDKKNKEIFLNPRRVNVVTVDEDSVIPILPLKSNTSEDDVLLRL